MLIKNQITTIYGDDEVLRPVTIHINYKTLKKPIVSNLQLLFSHARPYGVMDEIAAHIAEKPESDVSLY